MHNEALKRDIKVDIDFTSDEGLSEEAASVSRAEIKSSVERPPIVQQMNAQDPDTTDIQTDYEHSSYINTALGIFKNFKR